MMKALEQIGLFLLLILVLSPLMFGCLYVGSLAR